MLYLDLKYLNFISHRLDGFAQKKANLYNCRCPYCGDSSQNKRKKRGFFFVKNNELRYMCHNCSESHKFSTFLKWFDPVLFKEYWVERLKETGEYTQSPRKYKQEAIVEDTSPDEEEDECQECTLTEKFHKICVPVQTLESSHPANVYLATRHLPRYALKYIYFIDDTTKLLELNPDIDIKFGEPRIVIPFFDAEGHLIGLTCRSLKQKSNLRYLMVKLKDVPQVFGMERIDKSKTIYIVEGPIDSFFIPNCIAVSGTSFGKVDGILKELGISKDKVVLVLDNQPRNKEVAKILDKLISLNYNCVVWGLPEVLGKDINAMITDGGLSPKEVFNAIKSSTYSGLIAKAKFSQWKKVVL